MEPSVASVIADDAGVLASLSEIAGMKAKGQRLERRNHPFPARMPLVLAEHIIESMTGADARILDPMVGSGTTLIAAKRLQRSGIGFDLDPLSQLVARAETLSFRRRDLCQARVRIGKRARRVFGQGDRRQRRK